VKTIEYYLNLPYKMEIVKDKEGYVATFPELKGCITCAKTIEEVVVMAEDAKIAWITACIEEGIEITEPNESKRKTITTRQEAMSFLVLHKAHDFNNCFAWMPDKEIIALAQDIQDNVW